MTIAAKREYLATLRTRYQSTFSRNEKSGILTEVVTNLGMVRKSAIRALNRKPRRYIAMCPGRKEIYGFDLIKPLTTLWKTAGTPCSTRLKPQIPELLKKLKQFKEIILYGNQEELLVQMSTFTIDKLLESERDISKKEYGLSGTKRSPLLKTLIPVRTYFNEQELQESGHVEMDCVLHCGGSLSGRYAETLNVLDIATHWNEKKIFLNKTKAKVVGAFHQMRTKQFPFPPYSVDFDNGYEFVNWVMYEYCKRQGISFTRSRSYHKNDQAHIEGKNYQSIRKVVGYERISDPILVSKIDDLYQNEHRLLTNFFYTTMKLKEKTRKAGKVIKRYEEAQTPYQRVLLSDTVPKEVKQTLSMQYESLNPSALQRSLQKKLKYIRTYVNHDDRVEQVLDDVVGALNRVLR